MSDSTVKKEWAPYGLSPDERMRPSTSRRASPVGSPANGQSTDFSWTSVRQSPRIRCSGTAELHVGDNPGSIWGTLTDVSLHGCYVEINATLPVGTKISLVLKSLGFRFAAGGTVRTSYPYLGMGIAYAKLDQESLVQLNHLLDALTRSGDSPKVNSTPNAPPNLAFGSIQAIALVDELIAFFRDNAVLSRPQFEEMVRLRRKY